MSLPELKLDDRHFQGIVDETKERIPHYCKEWTDHNVSDPGVTLIELFAWMTDILIYRLNKVPDLHYIKFMEMLGIQLGAPKAAQTMITFWLAAPQLSPLKIPGGTAVATTQTETKRPIVFTTDEKFIVQPPELQAILLRNGGSDGNARYRSQNLQRLKIGFDGIDVFTTPTPQVGDAIYFGFTNDLSQHILRLELDFDAAYGAGINPNFPPYEWQATTGDSNNPWSPCDPDLDPIKQTPIDTTRGLNSGGQIQLHLPRMGKQTIDQQDLFWVRVRVKEISVGERERGMKPYDRSPRLRRVLTVATVGGTTPATNAQTITKEILGRSDATPGQRFHVQSVPILTRHRHERLWVKVDDQPAQPWTEVPDFADSGANDKHYTLDSVTGEVRLGPAVRQPNGDIKLYGEIPEKGATLLFEQYRYGGGTEGNVDAGALNTLKTAIPYVDRVANRRPVEKEKLGLDAETLAAAMMRAPQLLRTRARAVTAEDFEFLAREALPTAVGRVKCIQPTPDDAGRVAPGQVYVLIIPNVKPPEGYLTREQLTPQAEVLNTVRAVLDESRLLTTRLLVSEPAYHWVAVVVRLRSAPGVNQAALSAAVRRRLYCYLNPLTGGLDGKGWPFGRSLYASDVYQCLQGTPDVLFVRGLELYEADENGQPRGTAKEVIEPLAHGVIVSGLHTVEFV